MSDLFLKSDETKAGITVEFVFSQLDGLLEYTRNYRIDDFSETLNIKRIDADNCNIIYTEMRGGVPKEKSPTKQNYFKARNFVFEDLNDKPFLIETINLKIVNRDPSGRTEDIILSEKQINFADNTIKKLNNWAQYLNHADEDLAYKAYGQADEKWGDIVNHLINATQESEKFISHDNNIHSTASPYNVNNTKAPENLIKQIDNSKKVVDSLFTENYIFFKN